MSKSLSVIIGPDLGGNFEQLIATARSAGPLEIIMVIDPAQDLDQSIKSRAELLNCKVVVSEYGKGRIGYCNAAREATGEVLVFLSGESIIDSSQLIQFLQPIVNGHVDVVLNNMDPFFLNRRSLYWPDSSSLWREVFNDAIGYTRYHIDSLVSFPHALTKQVLNAIGVESLENPVFAHMLILEQGFRISCDYSIAPAPQEFPSQEMLDYRIPLTEAEKRNTELYLDALTEWHRIHGIRGNYHDGGRRRDIIDQLKSQQASSISQLGSGYPIVTKGFGTTSSLYNGKSLSIIIPAQNEEGTIARVIEEARKIEPEEIIVVVNGSTDNTAAIASQVGATVIIYNEPLGHDVGRAIGALEAKGDILLFIDADFPISSHDLLPFSLSIANGADVALNDLNLIPVFPLYVVSLYKYMLNIACDRKDLGIGSFVAVPHAISRKCLEGIGWDSLTNPCTAQVKAILQGYQVINVHYVDVMEPNRIRPDQHLAATGHPKAVLRINGDHLEALAYLNQQSRFNVDIPPPSSNQAGVHTQNSSVTNQNLKDPFRYIKIAFQRILGFKG